MALTTHPAPDLLHTRKHSPCRFFLILNVIIQVTNAASSLKDSVKVSLSIVSQSIAFLWAFQPHMFHASLDNPLCDGLLMQCISQPGLSSLGDKVKVFKSLTLCVIAALGALRCHAMLTGASTK